MRQNLTDLIAFNLWAFGDSTFSGESNTLKTFNAPGFYDVALTVTSQWVPSTPWWRRRYIWVYPLPECGFRRQSTAHAGTGHRNHV